MIKISKLYYNQDALSPKRVDTVYGVLYTVLYVSIGWPTVPTRATALSLIHI